MPEDQLPRIPCSITFLPPEKGAKATPRRRLIGGTYRPHVVLADVLHPKDREHLAVAFVAGPRTYHPGEAVLAEFVCLYHPKVDYSALKPRARFRLVEGTHVVAEGEVVESSSRPSLPSPVTRRIPSKAPRGS